MLPRMVVASLRAHFRGSKFNMSETLPRALGGSRYRVRWLASTKRLRASGDGSGCFPPCAITLTRARAFPRIFPSRDV